MDFLFNLFGQMMRMPLEMLASGAGWISRQPAGALRPANAAPAAVPVAAAGATRHADGRMQVLVVFEVFHTIISPERLQQAVTQTHNQLNRIFASGATVASGAFSAKRGGFVLLNVASGDELLQLLAPGLVDNCTIEVWPVLSFEQQGQVLQQIGLMSR